MNLKPLASMTRDEARDAVRLHAKLFAFRRYLRAHPGCDEEHAHAHAERHWRDHRDTALDYLAVRLALAEREAAGTN